MPAEKNDLEVYRDQLREVEADAARGMIDAQSAEQARIEISRRILSAEKRVRTPQTQQHNLRDLAVCWHWSPCWPCR